MLQAKSFADLQWEGIANKKGEISRKNMLHFQLRVWMHMPVAGLHIDKKYVGQYTGSVWFVMRDIAGKIIDGRVVETIEYFPTLDLAKKKAEEKVISIVKKIIEEAKISSKFPWEQGKDHRWDGYTYEKQMTYLDVTAFKSNQEKEKGSWATLVNFYMDPYLFFARSPRLLFAQAKADKFVLQFAQELAKEIA